MQSPSPPPPPSTPGAVYSNRFLREMLLALRLVAGRAYPQIVTAAGLGAYSSELPPPTADLTATSADIAHLFHAGYTHLAAPQAMLFFTNMGEHLARFTWDNPEVQALGAVVAAVPAPDGIAVAWSRLIEIVNREARVTRHVISDTRNDYLVLEDCPYCRDIHNAAQPVCFATARYYEVLLKQITGRSVIVREVECRATGHACCRYAIRRERPPSGPRL